MWGMLGVQEPEPLGESDGYMWGLSHLAYVRDELSKLEKRALERGDAVLMHGIADSKLRAAGAEQDLRKKLGQGQ